MEREKERVLVVDDDTSTLQSLKVILEGEGYTVDTVETGREAIEKTKHHHYDLALLDNIFSDMLGTDLLTKMDMGTPRMRAIMITGYPSLESVIASLNLGADAYVMKPIDPKKLIDLIGQKLKELEAERSELEHRSERRRIETLPKYYEPL